MSEATVVSFRGRQIDLSPYLDGFPYVGFEVLQEADLLLYFHDLPECRLLKIQPLDRPFDPQHGRVLNGIDWNLRSFWTPAYHRSSHALLFRGDEANDEVFNIYSLALDSGAVTRLTHVPYVNGADLSHDQTRLAYIARYAADGRLRAELRLRDMRSGEDCLVVADTPHLRFTWGRLLWSEDDSHLLVPIHVDDDRNRANLVWIDLSAPTLTPVLATDTPRSMLFTLKDWLDEHTCLLGSNESGYMQVEQLDLRDGGCTVLTNESSDYRSCATLKAKDCLLVATVGEQPQDSPMRVFDPRTGETVWEHVEPGSVFFLHSGTDVLYAWSTSLEERWTMWRLCVADQVTWERVATMPPEVVRATSHATVERLIYPTFDVDPKTGQRRDIHAFLLLPADLPPPRERRAFVLAFYGGTNTYNPPYQILAQAGFIVLSPAVRGSFGFGREFFALIDQDLGGNEMLDLIYGARYLQRRFGLQPQQIGVFGASR